MTDIINYGEVLAAEIVDKAYSKKRIAKKLAISYNTLMLRLKDGKFSQSQLKQLKDNRYL
jgi:hypothetical protein